MGRRWPIGAKLFGGLAFARYGSSNSSPSAPGKRTWKLVRSAIRHRLPQRLVQGRNPAILGAMRSRASRITATLVLLTCLIGQLLETLDHWDHTIQTGNDTEYTLVLLALCAGVAYSFARFVFKSAPLGFVAKNVFASCAQQFFLSVPGGFTLLLSDATGPPILALRI
jgi:hypothetical protein